MARATGDGGPVPAAAVLFRQAHQAARGVAARGLARGLEAEQRQQRVQGAAVPQPALRQQEPQALGLAAEVDTEGAFAAARQLALVEQLIEHEQHTIEPLVEQRGMRRLEGQAGNYDGIDPTEVTFDYTDPDKVTIALEHGGEVTFDCFFNGSTWETSVDILNLWDYGNGDLGNSARPPPNFARDVWSATFDAASGAFTPFTLVVDG